MGLHSVAGILAGSPGFQPSSTRNQAAFQGPTPYHRVNIEPEMQRMGHEQVRSDLKKLPKEIREALGKCKGLTGETVSCW